MHKKSKTDFGLLKNFKICRFNYDKYVCRGHTVTMSKRNNSMSILRGLLNDFKAEESACSS